ncbi:MAG: adenine phosphoribosyltransferase [Elusimicrobiota bacterium]
MSISAVELKELVRDIPDFPKAGIVFKDITTLLARGEAFHQVIDQIADHYANKGIKAVVGVESRGFIFSSAVAYKLGAGLIPVRKKGKLPYKTINASYDLEYGKDTLEIHQDAFAPGTKVLIVDDLLATGGTVKATSELVQKLKGEIVGLAFLIELSFLNGREKLKGFDIFSLIKY